MFLTTEDLNKWNVEDLKKYLTARGVPLSSGSCRKAQLIEKVLYAEKLELPILPTNENRQKEIESTRLQKLTVDDILKLPSPESLKCNWLEGSEYFPDLTLQI